MDTREQDGTSDLFVWGIIQQPASESQFKDPFNLPSKVEVALQEKKGSIKTILWGVLASTSEAEIQ